MKKDLCKILKVQESAGMFIGWPKYKVDTSVSRLKDLQVYKNTIGDQLAVAFWYTCMTLKLPVDVSIYIYILVSLRTFLPTLI